MKEEYRIAYCSLMFSADILIVDLLMIIASNELRDFIVDRPSIFLNLLTILQHQLVIHTVQLCHHYHQLQRHFIMKNFHMRSMPLFGSYQRYQKQLTVFASLIPTEVFVSLNIDIFHSTISSFQSTPSFLSVSMEEEL